MPKKTKSSVKKTASKAVKKAAKKSAVKAVKGAIKKATKRLSGVKSKATKAVKKATKGPLATKAKKSAANVKSKVRQVAKSAGVASKKAASSVQRKRSTRSKKVKPEAQQEEVMQPVITHGEDQHLIPVHIKNAPPVIHEPVREEKIFHNREEIAFHQENQKVKSAMASRMGRKRIFRIRGGS